MGKPLEACFGSSEVVSCVNRPIDMGYDPLDSCDPNYRAYRIKRMHRDVSKDQRAFNKACKTSAPIVNDPWVVNLNRRLNGENMFEEMVMKKAAGMFSEELNVLKKQYEDEIKESQAQKMNILDHMMNYMTMLVRTNTEEYEARSKLGNLLNKMPEQDDEGDDE